MIPSTMSPFSRIAARKQPHTVPGMLARPPVSAVPPITTAVRAFSGSSVWLVTAVCRYTLRSTKPASPARNPEIMSSWMR